MNSTEIERRKQVALEAIRRAYGTVADQYGATLFVSHHLSELGAGYWQAHLQAERPEPSQVLSLLTLLSPEEDDDLSQLDFSLPGNVSDYVISVTFDESGAVDEIAMES